MLELKTLGPFLTPIEMQEQLHNILLQVTNEAYSHFHSPRDEELFAKLRDYLGPADVLLAMMIENEENIRHFDTV